MHIQFNFQLVQQCIQISTRINSISVHTYILRLFYIASSIRMFILIDPIFNKIIVSRRMLINISFMRLQTLFVLFFTSLQLRDYLKLNFYFYLILFPINVQIDNTVTPGISKISQTKARVRLG